MISEKNFLWVLSVMDESEFHAAKLWQAPYWNKKIRIFETFFQGKESAVWL